VEHLLCIVELLDVLRQPMFGGVHLATSLTGKGRRSFNIAIFGCESLICEQHCKLSPDDTPMILCKRNSAQLTGVGDISMLAVVL